MSKELEPYEEEEWEEEEEEEYCKEEWEDPDPYRRYGLRMDDFIWNSRDLGKYDV